MFTEKKSARLTGIIVFPIFFKEQDELLGGRASLGQEWGSIEKLMVFFFGVSIKMSSIVLIWHFFFIQQQTHKMISDKHYRLLGQSITGLRFLNSKLVIRLFRLSARQIETASSGASEAAARRVRECWEQEEARLARSRTSMASRMICQGLRSAYPPLQQSVGVIFL